jgi:uncharacterized ion transporter superfamily protein YfcC
VGIAQKLAELPLLSGSAFRMVFLVIALALWIAVTMREALRRRQVPATSEQTGAPLLDRRYATILVLVIATFGVLIYGLLALDWGFNEMSALFFIMGIGAGLIGRLGWTGTADAYVQGFRDLAFAALLIGFARAIYVVLDQGRIIDTIVNGLFTPIADLPLALSALGMMVVQGFIHVFVPSVSGQAVLTMPVLTPLSDLLGLSRQVAVLAYHYGAGLCDLITPTNGALLALLAAGGVRYEEWLRFAFKWYAALMALGGIAVVAGILGGLR